MVWCMYVYEDNVHRRRCLFITALLAMRSSTAHPITPVFNLTQAELEPKQGRQTRCGWYGHGRTTFSGTLRNLFCQLNLFSNSGCIVGFSAPLEVPLQPVIFEQRAAGSGRGNTPRLLDSTAHAQSACTRMYTRA